LVYPAAPVVYEFPISDSYSHCPVPDKDSDCGVPGRLSHTSKVALRGADSAGVTNMVIVQFWPAAIELPHDEL